MKALLLALALLAPIPALAQTAAPPVVELREAKNYTAAGSPYLGYLSFWGVSAADKLTLGGDYAGRLYVTPGSFPNATTITWSTPLKPTKTTEPYGFLHIARGNQSGATFPKVMDPAKRIGDVTALPIAWDVDLVVAAGGQASLLSDTFLFTDDKLATRAAELGVFGAIGDSAKAWATGPQTSCIRTCRFVDPTGRAWITRRAGTYFMFIPEAGDALRFDGDLKWFFDYLMGAGLVTADMRYAGTSLGFEPSQGAGLGRIKTFSASAA